MEFTMQPEEATVLKLILTGYLPDLKMQIANTEDYALRQDLKRNEVVVKALIDRLEQAGVR